MSKTTLLMLLLAVILAGGVSAAAQDQGASKAPPQAGKPVTVVGCLTGYEGRYTLGTSSDMLYLLDGDSAMLKKYNARMVQASGTVTEPPPHTSQDNVLSQQPPTLTITKLKKVADGCN